MKGGFVPLTFEGTGAWKFPPFDVVLKSATEGDPRFISLWIFSLEVEGSDTVPIGTKTFRRAGMFFLPPLVN